MSTPASLTIFGAGKMGSAMLAGALGAGWSGNAITVIDPHASASLAMMQKIHGFVLNPAIPQKSALLLLAIKPQMLDNAIVSLKTLVDEKTVLVSILAGKSVADLRARMPALTRIIRAMPNTPAAIGRGITGAYATPTLDETERAEAHRLLATTGRVEWIDREDWIDNLTAVSGSGPAYVFYLAESLAKAGEASGLPAELAMRLARATIEGAGELLYQEAQTPPAVLRQNVTSPGGTTAAALEVLMAKDGLASLMERTVAAALARAKALSG